jgi:hypothetical protein
VLTSMDTLGTSNSDGTMYSPNGSKPCCRATASSATVKHDIFTSSDRKSLTYTAVHVGFPRWLQGKSGSTDQLRKAMHCRKEFGGKARVHRSTSSNQLTDCIQCRSLCFPVRLVIQQGGCDRVHLPTHLTHTRTSKRFSQCHSLPLTSLSLYT